MSLWVTLPRIKHGHPQLLPEDAYDEVYRRSATQA